LYELCGAWPELRLLPRPWDQSKLRDAFWSLKIPPFVLFLPILAKQSLPSEKNRLWGR
jgi:hypothetical protein